MMIMAVVCWYIQPTHCQIVNITRSPEPLTITECRKRAPQDAEIYSKIVPTWKIKSYACVGDQQV